MSDPTFRGFKSPYLADSPDEASVETQLFVPPQQGDPRPFRVNRPPQANRVVQTLRQVQTPLQGHLKRGEIPRATTTIEFVAQSSPMPAGTLQGKPVITCRGEDALPASIAQRAREAMHGKAPVEQNPTASSPRPAVPAANAHHMVNAHTVVTREFPVGLLGTPNGLVSVEDLLPASRSPGLATLGEHLRDNARPAASHQLGTELTTHYGLVAPPKDIWQAVCDREEGRGPDTAEPVTASTSITPRKEPSRRRLWMLVGGCVFAFGLLGVSTTLKHGPTGKAKMHHALAESMPERVLHAGMHFLREQLAPARSKAEQARPATTGQLVPTSAPSSGTSSENADAADSGSGQLPVEAPHALEAKASAATLAAPQAATPAPEVEVAGEERNSKDSLTAQPHVAVALYAEGRYKEALAEYRMLAMLYPKEKIYADIARILRRRLIDTCIRTQPHREAECNQL